MRNAFDFDDVVQGVVIGVVAAGCVIVPLCIGLALYALLN